MGISSDEEAEEQSKNSNNTNNKRRRAQKYRKAWEVKDIFKGWLYPDADSEFRAKCKICDVKFAAELSVIKRHANSEKHIKNAQNLKPAVQRQISNFTAPVIPASKQAQSAEIKIAGFFAAHNIPFVAVDHLVDILKESFPDSGIMKEVKLKKTKVTKIVKNVIGATQKEKLITALRQTKFSVLADESTDISAKKAMCIVVRYYDQEERRIVSHFWELVEIFQPHDIEACEEGATGKKCFETIMSTFQHSAVPIDNIIGFASDGCSVMMGKNNSVASRFRENCPGIMIIKCICHSLHLCASEACKCLPRACEDLLRNIYNFLRSSAKQQSQLIQFQILLNLNVHKILHPSQTRWLSLVCVVDRILEQWEALLLFFEKKFVSERLVAVEQVYYGLKDPFSKMYYQFLSWILPKFTILNQYFQSAKVVVTTLESKMSVIYTELLSLYLKPEYVARTSLQELDPCNEKQFKPLENLYLGLGVMESMKLPEILARPEVVKDFRKRCRDFILVGCVQLKKRYNFGDPVMRALIVFNPKNALSVKERETTPSLSVFLTLLPRIYPASETNRQNLDDEWRKLPFYPLPENVTCYTEIDQFWTEVLNYTDEEGSRPFRTLASFSLDVLSIPHANADCERVFSKVNLMKTKIRNSLATDTVNGAILASEHVRAKRGNEQNTCCVKFQPSDIMFRRMTTSNLYDKEKAENASEDSDCDVCFDDH